MSLYANAVHTNALNKCTKQQQQQQQVNNNKSESNQNSHEKEEPSETGTIRIVKGKNEIKILLLHVYYGFLFRLCCAVLCCAVLSTCFHLCVSASLWHSSHA